MIPLAAVLVGCDLTSHLCGCAVARRAVRRWGADGAIHQSQLDILRNSPTPARCVRRCGDVPGSAVCSTRSPADMTHGRGVRWEHDHYRSPACHSRDPRRPRLPALAAAGYTDVVDGGGRRNRCVHACSPSPRPGRCTLRLGTAIVPVFTAADRPCIAMSAASLASAAPGRFVLGLGASSPIIVCRTGTALTSTRPWAADSRRCCGWFGPALAGERIDGQFDTFRIRRFAARDATGRAAPIMLAGLRRQMLRLAGAEADGAILNWIAPDDVARCVEAVENPDVGSSPDIRVSDGRRCASRPRPGSGDSSRGHLTVPAYAEVPPAARTRRDPRTDVGRLGRSVIGRRALAAVPDDVVDALVMCAGRPRRVLRSVAGVCRCRHRRPRCWRCSSTPDAGGRRRASSIFCPGSSQEVAPGNRRLRADG